MTNAGSDGEELPPMLDQLKERYGRVPSEGLVDGGFATKQAIEYAAEHGCTVYESACVNSRTHLNDPLPPRE